MPTPDWKHLGEVVIRERDMLRLTQDELKSRGGPSVTLVGQIERGANPGITSRTKTALEASLNWQRGAVDEILAGATEPRRQPGDAMVHVRTGTATITPPPSSVTPVSEGGDTPAWNTRKPEAMTDERHKAIVRETEEYYRWRIQQASQER